MRILNCFLDNRRCGATLRGRRVADHLRTNGIETVFVLNRKQAPDDLFDGYGHRMLRNLQLVRKESPIRSVLLFLLYAPYNLWILCRWIRRKQIDVVQTNGILNVLPALAARLTGRKVLWLLNDMSIPPVLVFFLRPLVRRWSWRIGLCARKLGDHYFADDAVARRKFVLLVPPIESDQWRPEAVDPEPVRQVRSQFNLEGKSPVIAAIGNLNPAKGYEYFIEMAALLRRKIHSAVFVVAGSRLDSQKRYAQQIDRLIDRHGLRDSIRFLGYWRDVRIVLAVCDVFVLSSVREGNPTTVLEAMAMRRPVVAAEVGGVREQIEDGVSGVIVPPRNGEKLAEGVSRILAMSSPQRLAMTDAARARIEQTYDIRRVLQDYLRLFETLSNPSVSG
ncbi:MAG: glycosyltransferase family 4 protein [Phycisphaerae bacterium]|nr:glycosyltransferase family 4 protein [Phycisphaerae bacterium]